MQALESPGIISLRKGQDYTWTNMELVIEIDRGMLGWVANVLGTLQYLLGHPSRLR